MSDSKPISPSIEISLTEKEFSKIAKSHFENKDKRAAILNRGWFVMKDGILVERYKD